MKKILSFIVMFFMLFLFVGCIKFVPSDKIADIRKLADGEEVEVTGTVAQIVYGGNTAVLPFGFYLFDQTGSIYVYGPEVAETVEVGNKVTLKGQLTHYVLDTEQSMAEKAGYAGMLQIQNAEITFNDGLINEIPTNFIKEKRISDVVGTPVNEDISTQVFKMPVKIEKRQGQGFVNYYLHDLNQDDALYTYTSCNGKDFSWLDEYDGQTRYVYVAVHNAKMSNSGNFWRLIPIKVLEETSATDEQTLEFIFNRVSKQFANTYFTNYEFTLATEDEKIPNTVIEYQSNSELAKVVVNEHETVLQITASAQQEVILTVTINYNGKKLIKEVKFLIEFERPVYEEVIDIAEARGKAIDEEVYIQGIVAQLIYASGTSKAAGFHLIDETGSIAVYIDDAPTDITKITQGQFVILKGVAGRYAPLEEYQYEGAIEIRNAEVLYQDFGNTPIPNNSIEEKTLTDILAFSPSDPVTSKIFKTTVYIEKTSGSYPNYYLHDTSNYAKSIRIYSMNTGAKEFSWLDQYVGQTCVVYMTLRNGHKSSGAFNWRGGFIDVLEVVETSDENKAYLLASELESMFKSEYTENTQVEFNIPNNVTIAAVSNSTNVKITNNNQKLVVEFILASGKSDVEVSFTLTMGTVTKEFTIKVLLNNVTPSTIGNLRENATKGDTVLVNGIVSKIVYFNDSQEWEFFITDETGTMLCRRKAPVQVGDLVSITGKYDLYNGLPNIQSNGGVVTIISNENPVDYTIAQDATISELVAMNTQINCGGLIFTNVRGTYCYVDGKVYIQNGDDLIELYNYTNAKFYESNYKDLEALNGKEVIFTLVSYNLYKNQYTYLIIDYRLA